jgi:hypothetical protein
MKTLNELINEYTEHLQQGEIQVAYKGIMDFLGVLRAEFINKYSHYDVGGIYQGYMDMSYFSIRNKLLKEKSLKIAIVYLHQVGSFEIWLSAQNRKIAKDYGTLISNSFTDSDNLFHDVNNPDAILECILVLKPNFENQAALIDTICQGFKSFMTTVIDEL